MNQSSLIVSQDSCCTNQESDKKDIRRSNQVNTSKKSLVTRLNRVEGQIRGIKRLIEENVYCDDIINQISASQAALNGVAKKLLENHMKSCVIERIQDGDHDVLDEILLTVQKLMKK